MACNFLKMVAGNIDRLIYLYDYVLNKKEPTYQSNSETNPPPISTESKVSLVTVEGKINHYANDFSMPELREKVNTDALNLIKITNDTSMWMST